MSSSPHKEHWALAAHQPAAKGRPHIFNLETWEATWIHPAPLCTTVAWKSPIHFNWRWRQMKALSRWTCKLISGNTCYMPWGKDDRTRFREWALNGKQCLGKACNIQASTSYFQSKISGTYTRITVKIKTMSERTISANNITSTLSNYTVLHDLQIPFSSHCSTKISKDMMKIKSQYSDSFKNKWTKWTKKSFLVQEEG